MDSLRRIDADIYSRAHGLFEAKRSVLAPDAVERMAREVVARLASVRSDGDDAAPAGVERGIEPDLVNTFCDVLLSSDASTALTYVTEELAPTVASRTTLFIYIAAASRQLGARWEADEVSFTEVTLAVGKLYALVRSIGSSVRRAPIARALQKSALFASVPGEQHTLGVTIAAEVFRDAGWDVDLQLDRSHEELLARVDATMPAVVGLSLSGPARLDALVRLVVAVRLAKPDALIAVASGGDGKPETLRTVVDLDLVITDVRQAQLELSRLLQRRLAP